MECEVCGQSEEDDGIEIVEENPIQRCRRCKQEYERGSRDDDKEVEEGSSDWKKEIANGKAQSI